jgi:hypothetical protein
MKRELVGEDKNAGRELRPKADPPRGGAIPRPGVERLRAAVGLADLAGHLATGGRDE